MKAREQELDRVMGFLADTLRRADPVPDDEALAKTCAEYVTGNDRLTPAEQVDIYRRQFWLRHVDSLVEDYPATQHIAGDDAFDEFARAYLAEYPPSTPSLRDLGADIVAFAERYEGFPPERRAILVEAVRYEHAFVDIFDGPEPEPLAPAKIAGLPEEAWETARIVLSPLLVRMRLEHPVHRIRLALKNKEEPPPSLIEPAPVRVVLYRKDLLIHFDELDPLPADLLDALGAGEPLVAACDRLAKGLDEATATKLSDEVGAWFTRWTALRWITCVVVP